ncbi:MAG: hypothetical protein LBP55_09650 [Candidatus Adiutrix sp.]|jgi:tripartite-type tricarboxylate transporter receptor subunit TctC|nr:hypothetical protein [Candidatus Adiutrix sp.]
MKKKLALMATILSLALVTSTDLLAEWPERAITLVSSLPPTLPWSDQPNEQAAILEDLRASLSDSLGVPVSMLKEPRGEGVLAANLVAEAKPDGYLFGALGADAALARISQGYTPYLRDEIAPVAIAWQTVLGIITRSDFPADDLKALGLSQTQVRLAHTGLKPVNSATLAALEAARAAGFTWELVEVDRPDPDLLLAGQAEALVLPLGWLKNHPRADQFKVLTILTQEEEPPCGAGRPTLLSQGLTTVESRPLFTFYLPAKVNWRVRTRLSSAINSALRQEAMANRLAELCLRLYIEDIEGAEATIGQEYKGREAALEALGFAVSK